MVSAEKNCIQFSNHKSKWVSPIKYVCKVLRKTNISDPLIRRHSCTFQEVRNVSVSENLRTY